MIGLVDQQPCATVRHTQMARRCGNRAVFRDRFKPRDLAGADGDAFVLVNAQAKLNLDVKVAIVPGLASPFSLAPYAVPDLKVIDTPFMQ